MGPSFTITLLPISMEMLKIIGGGKIKTMAFSSLFLVNLRNPFLSIKSQSSKLPGLGPGLSSLFQTSPATGCFCGDSWDEAQLCVTEQASWRFWWMVGLQILTVDAQFSAPGVRPPNWHFWTSFQWCSEYCLETTFWSQHWWVNLSVNFHKLPFTFIKLLWWHLTTSL